MRMGRGHIIYGRNKWHRMARGRVVLACLTGVPHTSMALMHIETKNPANCAWLCLWCLYQQNKQEGREWEVGRRAKRPRQDFRVLIDVGVISARGTARP